MGTPTVCSIHAAEQEDDCFPTEEVSWPDSFNSLCVCVCATFSCGCGWRYSLLSFTDLSQSASINLSAKKNSLLL